MPSSCDAWLCPWFWMANNPRMSPMLWESANVPSGDGSLAGARVAAATKLLRNCCDIQLSFTAQAYTETAIGKLAKKYRYFNILDRKRVVYQSFAIFFFSAEALHLIASHPNPCQRTFAVQI